MSSLGEPRRIRGRWREGGGPDRGRRFANWKIFRKNRDPEGGSYNGQMRSEY